MERSRSESRRSQDAGEKGWLVGGVGVAGLQSRGRGVAPGCQCGGWEKRLWLVRGTGWECSVKSVGNKLNEAGRGVIA